MSQASVLVLVFDRDASTRAWYRAALASTDYRVAEAADGPEAVEVLASRLPDLVITELRPQHRDGLTLCVIKRENAATADIPIFMTMLDGDSDVEVAGRFAGASVLMERPSPSAVATIARELILAAPPSQVTRRQLHRTLADFRRDISTHPPQPAAIEEQARELLTHVASPLSSVMLANDEAKCMAANAAACRLTGYSEREMLTRSVWDFAPLDAVEDARMLWGRFLVNGECAGEFLMVQKDGATVAIQLCAQANITPGLHATVVG